MSLAAAFAVRQSRKYGLRVFMSETTGETALAPFDGWELVALPSGEVLDALPLEVPVPAMRAGSFQLLEAFA